MTSIRKRGWPGAAFTGLLTRRPEVPVVVTNPNHLHAVLDFGLKWYDSIRTTLTAATTDVVERCAVEGSFVGKVMRHYSQLEANQGYRSDHDFDK
jgi:hypothetical protein